MDITFRQLEIFRAVVVAGSITKASHRIGLSQPSISQQLAKLEETLGVQLILRNRTGTVSMTPAGEFWYKSSGEVLGRLETILHEHEQHYHPSNVVLRLGVTPVQRGRFLSAAARIAQEEASFVKFDLVYELNSAMLAEQLRMHRINFAIVAESALAEEASAFAIGRLYQDDIAWAVPSSVSDADIRYSLSPDAETDKIHPVLRHYVEIDAAVPTRAPSDDWYRSHQMRATPTFRAPTFAASIELVADGLATCHVPISLIPNLSRQVQDGVKLFALEGMSRTVVLAMRKHLLTHGAYARIFHRLVQFCQADFAPAMAEVRLRELPSFAPVADRPGSDRLAVTSANPNSDGANMAPATNTELFGIARGSLRR